MGYKQNGRDLVINGQASSAGGTFDQVKINGEGHVTGDVECTGFKIRGTSDVTGHVRAKFTEVGGTLVINGDLHSDRVKVWGTSNNDGDLTCQELNVKGTVDVGGNVNGHDLNIYGGLTVKGDCEAELFNARGMFTIGGLLNAGKIHIELAHHDSHAREIGGESIEVKRIGSAFGLNKILRPIKLTADTIEGDDIYLEYTKSKVVRGNNVSIGPGCEIDSVEYKTDFKQHKAAKVTHSKQV